MATAASVANCWLIRDKGPSFLALIMADVGFDAVKGLGKDFEGKPVPISTLWMMYINHWHLVTRADSEITKFEDLKGKRVSTGAPASGTEFKSLRILELYGLDNRSFSKWERLGADASAAALKDKKIDAYCWDGGLPTGSVLDLANTLKMLQGTSIVLLSVDDAHLNMLKAKFPGVYVRSVIPKAVYPGLEKDVPTVGVENIVVCHKNLPEEQAYKIVQAVFEHLTELHAVHEQAKDTTLKSAHISSAVPYHPGAIKYFKEKGVWPGS